MANPVIKETIHWQDFEKVELRVGTIIRAEEFAKAKKPAYKVWADFGEYGIKKTSAQITQHYTCQELLGQQIIGVLNFEPRQIADFMSEFLLTGFADENGYIVLNQPKIKVPNGSKLI
ncbi:MAG: tRNA-binding protein [Bacteroidia bacterium]|nr:tRNA-binding protein [Bacteroidia bacterium]MCF8447199.1 tRNA-binding protein [Bacteroidia bacterium]